MKNPTDIIEKYKYKYTGDFKTLLDYGYEKSTHSLLERYTNGSVEIFTGVILNYKDNKWIENRPDWKERMIAFYDNELNHITKRNLIYPLIKLGLVKKTTIKIQKKYDCRSDYKKVSNNE